MNISEATRATRNGAMAASISAALTIAIIIIAIKIDAGGELALWNDPSNFIDVVFILACAVGMYRKSRAASVLIFVYFLVSKVIITIETQAYSGLAIAIVFLYYFGKAIQGSFVYHKLKKQENPDYKAASTWAYIVGLPAALIFVSIISLALLSTTGVVPSTRVQSANEVGRDDIQLLRENGIISANETIIYIYSQGFSSVLESGNILTPDRVILYGLNDSNDLEVYEIPLQEVKAVVLESPGGVFSDSVYKVSTDDPGKWIRLFLSTEQKGDQKFVEALKGLASAT